MACETGFISAPRPRLAFRRFDPAARVSAVLDGSHTTMTTTTFRDRAGRSIGLASVNSIDELDVAVIDGMFERRYIVDIRHSGASCRTCGGACDHGTRVEHALADHGLLEGGS
jgi:hypothetical protein